jgi:hypothetical protein
MSIAIATVAPALVVAACGGSEAQTRLCFEPLGVAFGSTRFAVGTLLAMSLGILLRAQLLGERPRRPLFGAHFVAAALLTFGIVVNVAYGRTWIPGEQIRYLYLLFGMWAGVWLWWIYLSTAASAWEAASRLAVFAAAVKCSALVVNVIDGAGSIAPLFDVTASFWTVNEGRLSLGKEGSPIALSIEVLAPIIVVLLSALGHQNLPTWMRLAAILGSAQLFVLMTATGTRQGLVGLAAAAWVVVAVWRRRTPIVPRAVLVGLLILLFFVPTVERVLLPVQRVLLGRRELRPGGSLLVDRWRMEVVRRDLATMVVSNPVLGGGVGLSSVNNSAWRDPSHNLFASVGVELGMLPMAILAIAAAVAWKSLNDLAGRPLAGKNARFAVAACGGLFVLNFVGSLASGRLEGGVPWFGWSLALWLMGRQEVYGRVK